MDTQNAEARTARANFDRLQKMSITCVPFLLLVSSFNLFADLEAGPLKSFVTALALALIAVQIGLNMSVTKARAEYYDAVGRMNN